jgi:hypothetical protein
MNKYDFLEKYKLIWNISISDGKRGISHPLGATPGESLISDGATLTCKEQRYSESSSKVRVMCLFCE